ncbi:hypothetical protein CP967_31330 [Streptomyces nitrosporeus]|uniref:Uncharacterized protein n=1 Tax=Streptomyces nitrosporeus TaxID=28894 RepID=A0A5J6FHQ7_9ACTN|nr:hypothetical protein [Streptomyces nitrosporeus]QEU75862.1 hypothetical protein CP967_31330 [Streptomyces nitrosporeus]GGY88900.1 hypothetical protein GCM10010327_19560 [Streptomyces nitrosporeus]
MSRINVHKVSTMAENGEREHTRIPPVHENTEVASSREGEELSMAATIIDLVDALDNGEALVITRDIF